MDEKENNKIEKNSSKEMDEKEKIAEEKLVKKTENNEDKKETAEKVERPKKEKPKIKKTEAIVNVKNIPISTKYSIEMCRFIKNKKIENAIYDLEQVYVKKKAIPMRGEYGHKKGKGMGGGKYPKKASKYFIILLKSLSANAIANGLENPYISEAIANSGPKQMAKFGKWQRKRTHIKIIAKEKKVKKKLEKGVKK